MLGTKGRAVVLRHQIEGETNWAYSRRKKRANPNMYDAEHQELFAGIRSGNHINNGIYMSYSTMMAIMGREACYTGREITWDDAIQSNQDLTPSRYDWGEIEVPRVAKPGVA